VFPTATHTRFEHSIGTYHLARQMMMEISKKQPELNITDELIQLVAIAGLCHDLGHLLFSHLFDDFFLEKLEYIDDIKQQTDNYIHENRSIFLLRYAVDTYSIPLSTQQLHVIGDLINPKRATYDKWDPSYQVGKWVFQIVSNPLNSIDVDKFDYITRDTRETGLKIGFDYSRIISDARVIDDEICYSSQCSEDIYHMFFIRYRLHRQIYNHKAVKAFEILFVKLLFELEKEFHISSYLIDAEKMIELTDHFVFYPRKQQTVTAILRDIQTRKLPKMIYQQLSLHEITDRDIPDEYKHVRGTVIKFKVGYVGGGNNPLSNIHFYHFKNKKLITIEQPFSLLINQNHQEHFYRIYST
jgi:HD superfamily phosphohydrolase